MSSPYETRLNSPENVLTETSSEFAHQVAQFLEPSMTRQFLDALPTVVFVLNQDRQIVFANQALCNVLDVEDCSPLLGKRPGDVMSCQSALSSDDGCGAGDSCETCGALRAIISGLDDKQEDVQECLIARNIGDDVSHMTLRVWSVPLAFGGNHYTILSGIDISHERRRLALERTFFHDILNLVGSIRGFAELMEFDTSVDPNAISQRIQLAAQRVIDEIDTQRLLLAAEKGELRPDFKLLNSRQVLDELKVLYTAQEISRGSRLLLDDGLDEISFQSDAVVLRRVLGNMVKNAIEASRAEEPVTLGARKEGGQLVLWVHNLAPIPEQATTRIFQRDFSTKGDGRGLGTYSMRLLTQFLQGDVAFESAPESGTTFFVSLPLPS